MEQQMQKKEWKTPELIVLVRGKPEEAMLAFCKDYVSGSPAGADKACNSASDACSNPCNVIARS